MEATIPFRGKDEDGTCALGRLAKRLSVIVHKYQLELNDNDVVDCIQRAADLANRNLGNFATTDIAIFLDHTWSLLPEHSAALRRSYLYTVTDFQLATHGMELFLSSLNASDIFQSYRGVPDNHEMEHFTYQTQRNLERGRTYLRAKLLSACLVGAFATLTGGDAPMSFFIGDLPSLNYQSDRLGDNLPQFAAEDMENCRLDIYEILSQGRMIQQSFDTLDAPVAAYLYGVLGDGGLVEALKKTSNPMTPESSKDLLEFLPIDVVVRIGRDIAKIAVSRTDAIEQLINHIDLTINSGENLPNKASILA
jgi:hypothetical protein